MDDADPATAGPRRAALNPELRRLSRAGAFGPRGSYALRVRRATEGVCRREMRARLPPFPRAFGFSWRRAATPILKDSRCDAVATLPFPPRATIRICLKSCSRFSVFPDQFQFCNIRQILRASRRAL